MSKLNHFSAKGTKLEAFPLPKSFQVKVDDNLLAQAVHIFGSSSHIGLAKTKTRAEVNRTKRKVYRQKGTGGARHGARSAPIYVGGGAAHGPRPLKRKLKLNQKMSVLALKMALSSKASEGQVVVVKTISALNKTSEAQKLVDKILASLKRKKGKLTIILSVEKKDSVRFFRNLKNVDVEYFNSLNAHKVFSGGILVLDEDIFVKPKTKSEKK